MDNSTRRTFLRTTGAAAVLGVAGCGTPDGEDGGSPTDGAGSPADEEGPTEEATPTEEETDEADGDGDAVAGEEYPAIDRWLTETDIGDSDDTYDGTLTDMTGQDTVTVGVGVEGNGGNFAFGPAVVVSPGTEIVWEWTGEGGAHNVEALPEEQLGESDYEFSSGEPVDSADETHTRTLDEAGIALYHCEPHLSLGMKGGIAVE